MKRMILIALTLVALQACKKKEIEYVRYFCCDNFDNVVYYPRSYSNEYIESQGGFENVEKEMKTFCKELKYKEYKNLNYCGYEKSYRQTK